jgi:hypothetical protein
MKQQPTTLMYTIRERFLSVSTAKRYSQSHTKLDTVDFENDIKSTLISLSRKRTMKTIFIFISDLFINTLILSFSIAVVVVDLLAQCVRVRYTTNQPTKQRAQQILDNLHPSDIRLDQKNA